MTTVLLVLAFTAYLATLGRLATPRHDRLPLRAWTLRDVAANVARGARSMHELDARRQQIFETQLDARTRSPRRSATPAATRFGTHPERGRAGAVGTD